MQTRTCEICGAEYKPTAYNQRRCPACVSARRMKCETCGAIYTARAYNRIGNRSHCPDCLANVRGAINTHAAHVNSDDARKSAAEARGRAGQTNIRRAIAALSTSPSTSSNSHTHAHAKIWLLRDPHDNTVEVQNIRAFVREHPDDFPNQAAAIKAFYTISQTLQGRAHVRHPQFSCYGWTLVCPPLTPDDVRERREYRELKESRREQINANRPKNEE